MIADGVVVGRLRVAAPDDGAARLHAARLLESGIVQPSGLGPDAILCVRALTDPSPGGLDLRSVAVRPPPSWSRAVSALLDDALRRAARPIRDDVGDGPDAVLFADRAELIACLARDWLSGAITHRWWWRSLEPARSPERTVAASMVLEPRIVPSVLRLLALTGHATPLIAALPAATPVVAVRAIGMAFGIASVVQVADRLAVRPVEPSPHLGDRVATVRLPAAPWAAIVPEAASFPVSPERELLIGIGLAIIRAPADVATATFSSGLRSWAEARIGGSHTPRDRRPEPTSPPPPARWRSASRARSPQARTPVARPAPRAVARSGHRPAPRDSVPLAGSPARDRLRQVETREPARTPAPEQAPPTGTSLDAPSPVPEPRRVAPTRIGPRLVPVAGAIQSESTSDAEPIVDAWTRTQRGGAFYLLNVALALGLYGDFTMPRARRISLDPWDFVELIARRLGAGDDAPTDPIWALLGRLSSRPPGRQPGWRFRPHHDWHIDPAWLEPFAADRRPWRWRSTDGRLVVEHPAGYPILDVAVDGVPSVGDVRRALGPRHATALRRTSARPAAGQRSARDRWLDSTAAYIRARLGLALGPAARRRLSTVMFAHEAEIAVSSTAVDVRLSLDRLPIAIRIAGLDRDPGWIPAARRSITFHFA